MTRLVQYASTTLYTMGSILLSFIVPNYVKRLIYITSVYAVLFNLSEDDLDKLSVLNDRYKLAENPRTLIFPTYISTKIWNPELIDKMVRESLSLKYGQSHIEATYDGPMHCVLDERQLAAVHLASAIASAVPRWLRYRSKQTRIEDILWTAKTRMEMII